MEEPPMQPERGVRKEYDFISFMSLTFRHFTKIDLSITLLNIVLDDGRIHLRPPSSAGSYFSVTIAKGQEVLDARQWNTGVNQDAFPGKVALKVPIVKDHVKSERNQKLWSSMAVELQALSNNRLKNHPNVVSLLGICWHSVQSEGLVIMPTFVLEAAHADLEAFFTSMAGQQVTQRLLVSLAINIAAGMNAIHEVGIIHMDMKPKNVLIFKDEEHQWIAKIADFGTSLLYEEIEGRISQAAGTEIWSAPETVDALTKDELIKADIFSLGLVLWCCLSANKAYKILQELLEESPEYKRQGVLCYAAIYQSEVVWGSEILDEDADQSPSDVDDYSEVRKLFKVLWISTVSGDPSFRQTAREVSQLLRWILHCVLQAEFFSTNPLEARFHFTPLESEIWQHPELETRDRTLERASRTSPNSYSSRRETDDPQDGSADQILSTHVGASPEGLLPYGPPRSELHGQRMSRNSSSVIEAETNKGTIEILPLVVVEQICAHLKNIAEDTAESNARRENAAYEFACIRLSKLQLASENQKLWNVNDALEMLLLSARLGNIRSQAIVGSCYQAFGCEAEFDQQFDLAEWLPRAVKHGSLTAARRLRALDPDAFEKAASELRTNYAGIASQVAEAHAFTDEEVLSLMKLFSQDEEFQISHDLLGRLLHFAIVAGKSQLLRKLLQSPCIRLDLEWTDSEGSSALLLACRSGNAETTRLLLNKGAAASTANNLGISTLHFLPAFEESKISDMAHQLLASGAPLEARTTRAHSYRTLSDSQFGQVNGTPLAWAVAANSKPAVLALMELGADPFDVAGSTAELSDTFGNVIHRSPIDLASLNHQYHLLEVMLCQRSKTGDDKYRTEVANKLNDNARRIGTGDAVDSMSPLAYCATYLVGGLLPRILLHGDRHVDAFKETFHILIRHGSDPRNVDGKGESVVEAAIQNGQPFVIRFLLEWNNSALMPEPVGWLTLLLTTVRLSDRLVFGTLLEYFSVDSLNDEQWRMYFNTIAPLSDDTFFLESFRNKRHREHDYVAPMMAALLKGNSRVGSWFYDTGKCDLLDKSGGEATPLGHLLAASRHSLTAQKALTVFLKFKNLSDDLFYDVINYGESKLSALHLGFFHNEYMDLTMSTAVIHDLVERWDEPQYLNYQVRGGELKGQTPLHIAVASVNVKAVRHLLDLLEADGGAFDPSILDAEGRTVMDTAFELLKCQEPLMQEAEVPEDKQAAADVQHYLNSSHIILQLKRANAKNHKYLSAYVRPEGYDIHVFHRDMAQVPSIILEKFQFLFDLAPEQLAQLPLELRKAAKLKPNHAFFVVDPGFVQWARAEGRQDLLEKLSPESRAMSETAASASALPWADPEFEQGISQKIGALSIGPSEGAPSRSRS